MRCSYLPKQGVKPLDLSMGSVSEVSTLATEAVNVLTLGVQASLNNEAAGHFLTNN